MSAPLAFFVGKGGVGKTTVSAAYAVHSATKYRRKRFVLISTDPAHSLADVFQLKITRELQKVPGIANLQVWQVDAERRFQEFLEEYREPISELIENGTFLSRNEIDSFLKTTLPGLAEMSALLTIHDLLESGKYDEIVVDTAPIGHTLQLFRIPEQLARFLEFLELSGKRDAVLAAHFAGVISERRIPVLDRWEQVLSDLRSALSEANSRVVMVTSAEKFSLEESKRTAAQLRADSNVHISEVILNRVVRAASKCPHCKLRAKRTQAALQFLRRNFGNVSVRVGEDPGGPVLGAKALKAFGKHIFDRQKLEPAKLFAPPDKVKGREPEFVLTRWPRQSSELTLTLGKGGVGKTTVSSGLALTLRKAHKTTPVLICSTDPAPSLDDAFAQQIGTEPVSVLQDRKFTACELDATAEYRRWSERLKEQLSESLQIQQGGLHVELSFEYEMIAALLDIVPPGVDEVFAIFRIFDLLAARGQSVVLDMAPTGHALELLKTPERLMVWSRLLLKSLAAHRTLPIAQDLAVEVASIAQRARELVEMLRDQERSHIFVVMLAEPMPDRETRRLLRDLKDLGLDPKAVFINRLLFPEDIKHCVRCGLAYQWQLATLATQAVTWKGLRYAIREFPADISGKRGLETLTRELWQLKWPPTPLPARSISMASAPPDQRRPK
jgi:arsenite/tail-anchored protein-transporting ATPase